VYASFANHFDQGLHYAYAFILLLWVWPKLLFRRVEGDATERAAANFLLMTVTVIAMGYLLVLTKLLELLTVLTILTLWALYRWVRNVSAESRSEKLYGLSKIFFDYFEHKFRLRDIALKWCKKQLIEIRREWRQRLADSNAMVETVILVIVVAGAVYVRFYDAIVNAPPGMSDGNVTLLWLKYIDARQLFPEGIYPQGFHIYLDFLFKFASINALYVLKYTGPLNAILTMIGIHFLISRITGQRLAGIAAAFFYGWLGAEVGNGWERQAATNSQEFAMVIVFPALYFYHRYLESRNRQYLMIASAGLLATGFVHTLVFAFLIMGVAVLTAVHFLFGPKRQLAPSIWVVGTGIAASLTSFVPIVIGLLLGREFQSSSQEFLTSQTSDGPYYPYLYWHDYAAIAAIALLLLGSLLAGKRRDLRIAFLFGALFAGASFLLYYVGGNVTKSVVVASRSGDLWSYALPFVIGMGWAAAFAPMYRFRWVRTVMPAVLAAIMAVSFFRYPLQPIIPYKMEWNSSVEQYLEIAKKHRPKTWIIFSQEQGFALIYGVGYHEYIGNFLQRYDPRYKYLTIVGESRFDENIPHDVYIYEEKHVYRLSQDISIYPLEAPKYERREREMRELREWIAVYEQHNGPLHVFYEDHSLRIYHIHRPVSRDDVMRQIWNDEEGGEGGG